MNVEKKRMLNPSRRWLSSERVAIRVLEDLGYNILDVRKRIVINDTVVGEVDAIVDDGAGQTFAVEIKAGKIDVSGIRQAYVNSVILGMKPLVICKGFADDAARELAEKLGVKIIQLSDVFLVESEELETVLREVIEDAIAEYFEVFYGMVHNINPSYLEVLKAIAETTAIDEAAERLGVDVHTLMKKVDEIRNAGVIPRWARRYTALKRIAHLFIQRQNIFKLMDDITKHYELLKSIEQQLNQLTQQLSAIHKHVSRMQTSLQQLST
ncbi:MAG: recombinase RecB [Ignisphaera sp.]|nr:recombinase RecB [Ignisphaera sp.]MCX8167600.1 recombinase RecB [Ignisphaera sp.]MDW8085420.1 recombinase RecB [Ignisphaera sp.]